MSPKTDSVYEENGAALEISSGMRFSRSPGLPGNRLRRNAGIGDFRAVMVALARRTDEQSEVEFDGVSVAVGDCGVTVRRCSRAA